MLLSEELVTMFMIGAVSELLFRSALSGYSPVYVPDALKYKQSYYNNTSIFFTVCTTGVISAVSYYIYLIILNYLPELYSQKFVSKLSILTLLSILVSSLMQHTDIVPELREYYYQDVGMVYAYLLDTLWAFVLSTAFLMYAYSLRGTVHAIASVLYPLTERLPSSP